MEEKELKPVGFIKNNDTNNPITFVYSHIEIMDFLLLNHDENDANKFFKDYWEFNKNVVILYPVE